jgi:beta-lactam-binding protein with PASTA domain
MSKIIRTFFSGAVLVISGILAAWFVLNFSMRGKEVVVPDITGRDIIFALEVTSERDLTLRVSGWEYSDTIPKNYIISQKPLPGQALKKDQDIRIIISKGTKEVTIPKLTGDPRRKAEIILRRNGLKIGNIISVYSSEYRKDTVIAQDPLAQAEIRRGTLVNLLVSKGKKGNIYLMPDLTGKSLKEAMRSLESMGLKIGEVREELREETPPGLVFDQNPAQGCRVEEGEKVNLFVSKRLEPNKTIEGVYQLLYYKVPERFDSVDVSIILEDENETKEIYHQKEKGGKNIRLLVKIGKNTKAKIYLNKTLVEERVF